MCEAGAPMLNLPSIAEELNSGNSCMTASYLQRLAGLLSPTGEQGNTDIVSGKTWDDLYLKNNI
jgi:hypothetical protein